VPMLAVDEHRDSDGEEELPLSLPLSQYTQRSLSLSARRARSRSSVAVASETWAGGGAPEELDRGEEQEGGGVHDKQGWSRI
jgi:hypothetical protein